MSGTVYLFAAFAIAWLFLFFYIFRMLRIQRSLEIQMDKIKKLLDREFRDQGSRH